MAEWNFDPLQVQDNPLPDHDGGMWAGLEGIANADDFGVWSSDTWIEPTADDNVDALPTFAPPAQHVNEDHQHPTLPDNNRQIPSHATTDPQSANPATHHRDADHYHSPPQHLTSPRRQSHGGIPPRTSYPADTLNPSALLYQGAEEQIRDYQPIPGDHSQALYSDTDDEDDMAPHNRRQRCSSNLVDLTQSPAVPTASVTQHSRTRKRSSTSAGVDGESGNKRTKRASTSVVKVDDEDLQDEAPSADEELLKAQQQEALKMQEANKNDSAVKIGQRTCIICLENYTSATISSCGHIFCHECLTRALIASEKNNDRGVGNCPACRKAINRKKAHQVIPINFLKKSAFKTKGRQAHNR